MSGLALPGPLGPRFGPALSLGLLRAAVASIVAALALRYLGGMSVISPAATLVTGGLGVLLVIGGLESSATG